MNFKQWLITEELYPNKTAVVYHRTYSEQNISNILNSGFRSGAGNYYGEGFYATFALESQFTQNMERYGNFVLKFKVTDLDKYLICQLSVAKYILGNDYSISSQFKKFNIQETEEQLKEYDKNQMKSKFSSSLASSIYAKHADLTSKCKGIIFRGESDGYVLVKYEPVNDATITMLGYAEADTSDFTTMNKLAQNKDWITSTNKAKIKSVYNLPSEKKADYNKAEIDKTINLLLLATPATIPYLAKKYASNIKNISNNTIIHLITISPNKNEIAEAIISNKPNIPDAYIEAIIYEVKDKSKIVETIVKNRKEISSDIIVILMAYAKDKDKMAETIINKKQKISYYDVYGLIEYAIDKDKIAELILNKLPEFSNGSIEVLIQHAIDKDKIAEMIINKYPEITDKNIEILIQSAKDKDKIAKLLGSDNISKLDDWNVSDLLSNAEDKEQIAQILNKYHQNKTPQIQELIDKYLS